jgi:uncharacterized Tic20 family protein
MTAQAQKESFASVHTSDERTMAALAHGSAILNLFAGIGGLIGAFVIWMTQKEKSAWVAFHALQSLVFQAAVITITVVVVVLVWIVGFAVSFATIGIGTVVAVPVMILVFFGGLIILAAGVVYSLYGAYQIYEGREFRYKWVGNWLQQRSSIR